MEEKAQVFHNDSLQLFNEKLFDDIIGIEHLSSKKKAITYNDVKSYGYFFEKKGQMFFLQDFPEETERSVIDILPIKVITRVETDYNKDVFFFITKYSSVKIPSEKKMSMNELVNNISCFKHTNPKHFLLYKIICLSGFCNRINFRVISERGFGKDSVINNLKDLVSSISNIYGATFAKLEYSLKHKFLIFNEMGNLKADDKYNMQSFLLATGAYFNKYTKKSRATADTQEEYDISKTSLGILYNPPVYYVERGQEFFDTMFTQAVINRFIPFYFEGVINETFDSEFDVEKVVDENIQLYKDIISTIRYYKDNAIKNKYIIPDDIIFSDDLKRYERTFLTMADFISEYSCSEQEYYELLYELWACYKKYDEVLREALIQLNKGG